MNFLDAFFESYYRLRPVNATFTGIHDFDDRLPDWSPDGLASALAEMRALQRSTDPAARRAADVDLTDPAADVSSLEDVALRDCALARAFLDVQIAEHQSGHFQQGNPSLVVGEAIFGVVSLITRPFAPAADRADAVLGRLAAIPPFLDGAWRSMAAAVPDDWRVRALRECEGARRLLEDGLSRWTALEAIDDGRAARLREAARTALAAMAEFRRRLEGRAAAGPEALACGPDLFDLLLERGHCTGRSRGDLLAEARAALDEALARLGDLAARVAPGGWPEIQARLTARHPDSAGYLAAYQAVWEACRETVRTHDLVGWPDYPIRYVPIPAQTRDAAPLLYYLFYRSPAPFDRLPVHDYVVTPIDADLPADEQERRLRATNASVIKLNHVVHHGAIGHHVQNYYAYHGESEIGRVAAVDCASRIGMFCGGTMAEGWACYATDLMEEVGFLTAEESVAQQHTRARLRARAVADIALHERSMSPDEVVALYRDRVGMTPEAARAEACKNSMFPGTAVMYWLGADTLHALRRDRTSAEGAGFSLRRFHEQVLLFGSIPVPLVARLLA